jgi:hypothetical protein
MRNGGGGIRAVVKKSMTKLFDILPTFIYGKDLLVLEHPE